MYTTKTIQEINEEKWKNYGLCYIESIDKTHVEFSKETLKVIEKPGFSWDSNEGRFLDVKMVDVPNPDYIEGSQELYAYFTPVPLQEQWGDDWDDSPYEYNAGAPYDHGADYKETEILILPFAVSGAWDIVKEPKDWGGINSPWSVEDINRGVIPWLYLEKGETWRTIHAGIGVEEFIRKLKGNDESGTK
jgi:hypothetical protein